MNNFCSKCGTSLKDNAKFCSACGTKVETENFVPTPISPESQEHYEEFNSPPIQNQKTGLYATFYDIFLKKDGRLKRWRYFTRSLVVNIFFAIILAPFNNPSAKFSNNFSAELFLFLFILAVCGLQIYIMYCLQVRRLHDLNTDATIAVLFAICTIFVSFDILRVPLIILCFFVNMSLLFKRGSVGSNKYGADPLADKNY